MPAPDTNHDIPCLTFELDEETFAVEVHRVREVLDPVRVTKIPRAPSFLQGVINVRGNVIPIVDLHKKLGASPRVEGADSRIVILEAELEGELTTLGAIADAVREVTSLSGEDMEPPPKIGSRWKSDFIQGIGTLNDEFVILLDIDRIFSAEELTCLQETGTPAQMED